MENKDFTHSSRKSYSLLRRLGGATTLHKPGMRMTLTQIASHIKQTSKIRLEISEKIEKIIQNKKVSTDLIIEVESNNAMTRLKAGKAAGAYLDGILCKSHLSAWQTVHRTTFILFISYFILK